MNAYKNTFTSYRNKVVKAFSLKITLLTSKLNFPKMFLSKLMKMKLI